MKYDLNLFTEFVGEDVWSGLINPKGVDCQGNSCLYDLSWASDGATMTKIYNGIQMNDRTISTVIKFGSLGSNDRKSWKEYKFVCQFSCSPGSGEWPLPIPNTHLASNSCHNFM